MKRLIAILLMAAALLALIPAAAAVTQTFPDIQDEQTAKNVAALQMLGVIDGDGGYFLPDGKLTRAAFCKMAVVIMGRGGEEPQYRSRTIFPDVRSNHWARGYINLAVSGEQKLIIGNSDGTFKPDDNITYAQAITILVRMLGYTDADAGMLWPAGYLELAAGIGLTKDVSVAANEPIPRADAAQLFCNLLAAAGKDGQSFLSALGTPVEDVMVMDTDVAAPDGTAGAIKTSAGVFKTSNGIVPEILLGQRGTLVTDAGGRVLTFIHSAGKSVSFIAASADAGHINASDGLLYNIPQDTAVFTPDGNYKFIDIFIDIAPGMPVTVFYKNDKIEALYINTEMSNTAFVVTSDSVSPSAFLTLTGGDTGCKIYKNGIEVSYKDIQKYDVVTYSKAARVLTVSDFRITCCYENVWPNPEYPSKVTLIGKEFSVLPSARDNLSAFKIGSMATFLMTADNQIAGVFAPNEVYAAPIGIVDAGITAKEASVTLFNGMTFSGNPNLTDYLASKMPGELVAVSSSKPGGITLSKIGGIGGYNSGINLNSMTVGTMKISPTVRMYERAGVSGAAAVTLSELVQREIPASKILYIAADSLGRADMIILSDLTGDLYTYGFLELSYRPAPSLGGDEVMMRCVSVRNKDAAIAPLVTTLDFKHGGIGGVVISSDGEGISALVTLTAAPNISRSAFKTIDGKTYVTTGETDIPVASKVQCYNKTTGKWFESLAEARAYSNNLTLYYDRPPSENGKVRFITAE